ncbi:type II secretion system F family protein [Paenibacillus sp. 1A_MP2]|uniref:type II secretion system F family protein n=1 Tax=Paenibacillus sp. 1A_MP2 TaxID=3457495 RepID=UPI003FCD4E5D
MQLAIILLSVLFTLFLCYPLMLRSQTVSDQFYRMGLVFEEVRKSGNVWKAIIEIIKPYMGNKLIDRFDRLLRVAGRPGNRTAEELILVYAGIVVVLVIVAFQLENAKEQAFALALMYPLVQISRLRKAKLKRQIEAEEATRIAKRQLILMLEQKIPVVEALEMISKDQPGHFGETFRKYVEAIDKDGKSLRAAMKEFREDYETRALTELCLALELSDEKSAEALADMIRRQTTDENNRIDEIVDSKQESGKNNMLIVVAAAVAWTFAGVLFFGFIGFKDNFQGAGGFLNF